MPLPLEKRYTLADALSWDGQERVELIDGCPMMMSPPPVRVHQKISGELFGQLRDYLKGKKCEVYHAPFAVRPFERNGDGPEDVDTLVEPASKSLQFFALEDGRYAAKDFGAVGENLKVNILEECMIDLSQVFLE